MFAQGLAPMSETQIPTSGTNPSTGLFVFYVGPGTSREFAGARRKGAGTGMGDRCRGRTVQRRYHQRHLVLTRHSAHKGRGVEAGGIPVAAGGATPVSIRKSTTCRRGAARLGRSGAARRRLCVARSFATSWAGEADAEGAGVGTHRAGMRTASQRGARRRRAWAGAAELDRRVDDFLDKRRWMLATRRPKRTPTRTDETHRRLVVRRARAAGDRRVLRPAGAWPHRAQLTDFDIYALEPIQQTGLGFGNYFDPLATADVLERRWATPCYFVRISALSLAASLGAAALLVTLAHAEMARCGGWLFAPLVTTLVAVAVIWNYLFHTQYGLVNWLPRPCRHQAVDWLGDPHWALPATIILFVVEETFGYNMVIFIAGLQAIPGEL